MKYMITIPAKGLLASLPVEAVSEFKSKIQESISNGRIVSAHSKVGGGLVIITDIESHGHLIAELRKHQIMDATVEPLVDFVEVLGGYVESKTTGVVGMALASA
ncbi:hypothetical protein [Sphingomonas sp. 37zxx]|uniref:hypothetical protein n=1 Tax=Sphingomonas sp. 37zxx TaxID=1550073 RepID=UPI00053BE2D6|nr:hypothetical protein [Sphingomonas sp. 37zxx]